MLLLRRTDARATLLRDGREIAPGEVEDYAFGEIILANGLKVRLATSWNLNAGQDALIETAFYGTEGGAKLRNDNGSFFDFSTDLFKGRSSARIAAPPEEWGGRAAVQWVHKLARGERFSGTTTGLLQTALTIDRLYGRS